MVLGSSVPADEQHSSYLVDSDLFLSADSRYVSALITAREDAPFAMAEPRLVSGDQHLDPGPLGCCAVTRHRGQGATQGRGVSEPVRGSRLGGPASVTVERRSDAALDEGEGHAGCVSGSVRPHCNAPALIVGIAVVAVGGAAAAATHIG
jgi:hypothetical protein